MKRIWMILLMLALADEDEQQNRTESVESQKEEGMVQNETGNSLSSEVENNTTANERSVSEVKIKITVGETELIATMEDNATTQAIIEQMPMTLPMMDLYGGNVLSVWCVCTSYR